MEISMKLSGYITRQLKFHRQIRSCIMRWLTPTWPWKIIAMLLYTVIKHCPHPILIIYRLIPPKDLHCMPRKMSKHPIPPYWKVSKNLAISIRSVSISPSIIFNQDVYRIVLICLKKYPYLCRSSRKPYALRVCDAGATKTAGSHAVLLLFPVFRAPF